MKNYNITITVKANEEDLLGIKEALATLMEMYSDLINVDVTDAEV